MGQVPMTDVDLEVTEAEIGLIDATPEHDLGTNGQIKILAVQPYGTRPIGEPIFVISNSAGNVADEGHVAVIHVQVIARVDYPTYGREMVGLIMGNGVGRYRENIEECPG